MAVSVKKIMDKKAHQFMEAYLNNPSPTSYEWSGQKIWLDYIKPYIDEYQVDNYGTVYGVINPGHDYKVVIEAHADEISWYVKHITDEGYIYVTRNGGSDHQIAPAKRLNIHTEKGIVKGVFGWPAIHLRNGAKEESPTMKNIFVDVGCNSKKEVLELGIHVGTVMTFEDEFFVLNDRFYTGRALDNRMGGFCIAQVARLLHEKKAKLPYSLYIINAVQEEVGLNGAKMVVEQIRPNVAIVTDVAHDTTTPMIKKTERGEFQCGKGPIVTHAPAVQMNLLKLIKKAAKDNKIPLQLEASSRSTGTDTDAFAFGAGGVVSALISIPLKYMHTTNEMAHKDDIDKVIQLYYHSLLAIEENHDFRYFS